MVLKLTHPWEEGGGEEEEAECTDGGSESCDSRELLSGEHSTYGPYGESPARDSTSASPNPPTDDDDRDFVGPPVVFKLVKDSSLDIKRTSSAPIWGQQPQEPPQAAVPLRERKSSEGSSLDDSPDGPPARGNPLLARHTQHSRLVIRLLSDFRVS